MNCVIKIVIRVKIERKKPNLTLLNHCHKNHTFSLKHFRMCSYFTGKLLLFRKL